MVGPPACAAAEVSMGLQSLPLLLPPLVATTITTITTASAVARPARDGVRGGAASRPRAGGGPGPRGRVEEGAWGPCGNAAGGGSPAAARPPPPAAGSGPASRRGRSPRD